MGRAEALEFLAALTDKEFAELFYESVRRRNTSDIEGEPGHFVLGDAREVSEENRWIVEFIALPTDNSAWDAEAPICQSGRCRGCGVEVRSWAKALRCPVCSRSGAGS